MPISCLVFDCDGVLLESVDVKTRAFARLTEPYGIEAQERMVLYHTCHGGQSRTIKFAWFFREVLEREITAQEMDIWSLRFSTYTYEEVCRCPMIAGAQEALRQWHGQLPMYVCSGTPHDELRKILADRNLTHYFTDIYGTPPAKDQLLAAIARSVSCPSEEILMVGDSPTDRMAAEYAATAFYGVGPLMRADSDKWGMDLTGLSDWIQRQNAHS